MGVTNSTNETLVFILSKLIYIILTRNNFGAQSVAKARGLLLPNHHIHEFYIYRYYNKKLLLCMSLPQSLSTKNGFTVIPFTHLNAFKILFLPYCMPSDHNSIFSNPFDFTAQSVSIFRVTKEYALNQGLYYVSEIVVMITISL